MMETCVHFATSAVDVIGRSLMVRVLLPIGALLAVRAVGSVTGGALKDRAAARRPG